MIIKVIEFVIPDLEQSNKFLTMEKINELLLIENIPDDYIQDLLAHTQAASVIMENYDKLKKKIIDFSDFKSILLIQSKEIEENRPQNQKPAKNEKKPAKSRENSMKFDNSMDLSSKLPPILTKPAAITPPKKASPFENFPSNNNQNNVNFNQNDSNFGGFNPQKRKESSHNVFPAKIGSKQSIPEENKGNEYNFPSPNTGFANFNDFFTNPSQNQPNEFQYQANFDDNGRDNPFNNKENPFNNKENPFSNHEIPINNKEAPFNNHFNNQENPFNNHEIPINNQENPFNNQENPFNNQENPFNNGFIKETSFIKDNPKENPFNNNLQSPVEPGFEPFQFELGGNNQDLQSNNSFNKEDLAFRSNEFENNVPNAFNFNFEGNYEGNLTNFNQNKGENWNQWQGPEEINQINPDIITNKEEKGNISRNNENNENNEKNTNFNENIPQWNQWEEEEEKKEENPENEGNQWENAGWGMNNDGFVQKEAENQEKSIDFNNNNHQKLFESPFFNKEIPEKDEINSNNLKNWENNNNFPIESQKVIAKPPDFSENNPNSWDYTHKTENWGINNPETQNPLFQQQNPFSNPNISMDKSQRKSSNLQRQNSQTNENNPIKYPSLPNSQEFNLEFNPPNNNKENPIIYTNKEVIEEKWVDFNEDNANLASIFHNANNPLVKPIENKGNLLDFSDLIPSKETAFKNPPLQSNAGYQYPTINPSDLLDFSNKNSNKHIENPLVTPEIFDFNEKSNINTVSQCNEPISNKGPSDFPSNKHEKLYNFLDIMDQNPINPVKESNITRNYKIIEEKPENIMKITELQREKQDLLQEIHILKENYEKLKENIEKNKPKPLKEHDKYDFLNEDTQISPYFKPIVSKETSQMQEKIEHLTKEIEKLNFSLNNSPNNPRNLETPSKVDNTIYSPKKETFNHNSYLEETTQGNQYSYTTIFRKKSPMTTNNSRFPSIILYI